MRIVLGIDEPDRGRTAVKLLKRLRFPDVQVDVTHVVETLQLPGQRELRGSATDAVSAYEQRREEEAHETVAQVAHELREAGFVARTAVLHGFAADQLMEYSDRTGADLIAVASRHRGPLEAFFTGSVSRGLVIGAHQSILIAKGEPMPETPATPAAPAIPATLTPVTAVLADDHSVYMNRCIGRLAALAPGGIERLIVLTAYQVNPQVFAAGQQEPQFAEEVAQCLQEKLHEKNQALCDRLHELTAACTPRAVSGQPTEIINSVMAEAGADLLILGAQGHGFVERLKIGSLSFHEVMAEPHSVLVLRV